MLRAHVGDSWKLLAIPLVPMADGLVNAALDLPMWTTLGNDMSPGADYVGLLSDVDGPMRRASDDWTHPRGRPSAA